MKKSLIIGATTILTLVIGQLTYIPASATPTCTITVTASNTTVNGTSSGDVICLNADNLTVNGLGGNDTVIDNGTGNTINLGEGLDVYIGTEGEDGTVEGGPGNDTITGTPGEDELTGGDGDDTLIGGEANDTLNGGIGNDDLAGSAGEDILNGEAGTDELDGGEDPDTLNGGPDADLLIGGSGNDTMNGGLGNDELAGGVGNDELFGESGTDTLRGEEGNDIVAGGADIDELNGGAGLNYCDLSEGEARDLATCIYDDDGPTVTMGELPASVEVGSTAALVAIDIELQDVSGVKKFGVGCTLSTVQSRVDIYNDPLTSRGTSWVVDPSSTLTNIRGTINLEIARGTAPGAKSCFIYSYDSLNNYSDQDFELIVFRSPAGQASQPTSVSYTPTNPTSGTLTWSPPVELGSPNMYAYVAEISQDGTTWSALPGGATSGTSLAISSLQEGTEYWLRVRGENGGTVGQDTRYMNLNWGVVEFTTPQATAPDAPTHLVVSNVATNSFRLGWTAPAYSGGRDINNFTVEYSTNNGDTWRNAKAVNAPNSTSLFFNVTSAAPATRYLIRVAAVNVIGASQYLTGEARTLATVPTAPRTLTVSNLSNTSLTLSWILPSSNGGGNITDYKVEYAVGTSNTWTEITHTPFVDLAFNVNSLRSNQAYRFRVSAINEGGTGAASNIVSVTTLAGPPQEPTNLTASRVTATGASLAWRAPSNTGGARITDYQVETSRDNGETWSTVSKRVSNSTSLALTGLAPATNYLVRVSAVNRTGTGAAVTSTFTTLAGPPSAPINLRSTAVAGTTATIAWDLPASNGGSPITNYRVEVSSNCKNYTTLPRTASNSLAHNVTNLQPGLRYCFRASTINAVGTSSASTVLELTTVGNAPNAPISLSVQARATQVTLSWAAATVTGGGPVRNYLVEYSTNGGTNWINVTKPVSTSRTLVIRNLTRSTAYLFRVYATNDSGTSPASANLAVTTPVR